MSCRGRFETCPYVVCLLFAERKGGISLTCPHGLSVGRVIILYPDLPINIRQPTQFPRPLNV